MIIQITPTTFQRGRKFFTDHRFVGFHRVLINFRGLERRSVEGPAEYKARTGFTRGVMRRY